MFRIIEQYGVQVSEMDSSGLIWDFGDIFKIARREYRAKHTVWEHPEYGMSLWTIYEGPAVTDENSAEFAAAALKFFNDNQ